MYILYMCYSIPLYCCMCAYAYILFGTCNIYSLQHGIHIIMMYQGYCKTSIIIAKTTKYTITWLQCPNLCNLNKLFLLLLLVIMLLCFFLIPSQKDLLEDKGHQLKTNSDYKLWMKEAGF